MNVLNDLTLRICLVYISSGNEFIEATLLFSKGVLSLSVCSVAAIYISPPLNRLFYCSMELEMKKVLLPLAALVLSATAYNAMAANGTVTFTGEIKQSTCQVTSDTQNKEVYLGTYPTSAFPTVGSKSASKAFQISLEKCDAGDYSLRFDGNTVAGNPDLLSVSNVGGTGAAATGVGIEITDNNGKPFAIGDGSNINDDVAKVTIAADGKATFNLQARYRSFDSNVTAGLANATSPFTIEYK